MLSLCSVHIRDEIKCSHINCAQDIIRTVHGNSNVLENIAIGDDHTCFSVTMHTKTIPIVNLWLINVL